MNCNNIVINPETGEIVGELTKDNYIGSKSQDELRKSFAIEKEYYRTEGKNFVFTIYDNTKKYLEQEKLKPGDVARLIVLATYMNYDGKIMKTQRTSANKSDMRKIVRLNKYDKFNDFLRRVSSVNLVFCENNEYYMNEEYFCKGKLSVLKNNNSAIRVYCDTIQYLFENIKTSDIKRIGYLFQLIPYINYNYNIICWNPNENNILDIKPMLIKDIQKILGVGNKGVAEIIKTLTGIKLKNNQPILGRFKLEIDNRSDKLIVNPDVMYRGKLSGQPLDIIRMLFI